MDWVFILFGVGTFAYALSIVKEYMEEARLLDVRLQRTKLEKTELEDKIQEHKSEKDVITVQIEEKKQVVQELQTTADKQQVEIKHLKDELAKRGKYRL